MKESYDEELATHIGLVPYGGGDNVLSVASARGTGVMASCVACDRRLGDAGRASKVRTWNTRF